MTIKLSYIDGGSIVLLHVQSIELVAKGYMIQCFGNDAVLHRNVSAIEFLPYVGAF